MIKYLECKSISSKILQNIKIDIQHIINKGQRKPKLCVVQVGDYAPSTKYINYKRKAAEKIGIDFLHINFDENILEHNLIKEITALNDNQDIDGIIVQLPLPKNINSYKITNLINPKKDVDGFSNYNLGALIKNNPNIIAATPLGIMNIFKYHNIDLNYKNVAIIGRSNIVGKPLALLMTNHNATVTICHTKTKNIKNITLNSDIVVVAAGQPNLLTNDMVKENTIIIDVGTNYINNKLIGDVDVKTFKDKNISLTPVPGGVGPMTIATLLENTYFAWKKNLNL